MHRLFTLSSEMVCITTFEGGGYLYANEAYLALFGYRREELVGKRVSLWADPADRSGCSGRSPRRRRGSCAFSRPSSSTEAGIRITRC